MMISQDITFLEYLYNTIMGTTAVSLLYGAFLLVILLITFKITTARMKKICWGIAAIITLIPFSMLLAGLEPLWLPTFTVTGDNIYTKLVYLFGTAKSEHLYLVMGIWLIGVIVFAVYGIVKRNRFRKTLKQIQLPASEQMKQMLNECREMLGIHKEIALVLCAGKVSPFITGVKHPKIVFPAEGISEEHIRYAMLHELTHYKRGDLKISLVCKLICILQWFNPFAWVISLVLRRYCEEACDEAVIELLNSEERKQYGTTIVEITQECVVSGECCYGFVSTERLKHRIKRIIGYKKPNKAVITVSAIMLSSLLRLFYGAVCHLYERRTDFYGRNLCYIR